MLTVLLIVVPLGLCYGFYAYRRIQVRKAGGVDAHSRAQLARLFRLPPGEHVTAAWSAVTVPKLSAGDRALEAVGVATALAVGVGVQVVGRPLAIAFTSQNRLLVLDRESEAVYPFGPWQRPAFSETGKQGSKRTSQTKFGWHAGAIVRLDGLAQEPMEIDIIAEAVPMLVGWSRGADASVLDGPYPVPGTI